MLVVPVAVTAVVLAARWVACERRRAGRGDANPAKWVYVGATAGLFAWMLVDPVAGFVGYVGAHAVEYFVIVHHALGSRYTDGSGGVLGAAVRPPAGRGWFFAGYGAVLVALILVLDRFGGPEAYGFAVLLLGGLHVFYDGFIWKLRRPAGARDERRSADTGERERIEHRGQRHPVGHLAALRDPAHVRDLHPLDPLGLAGVGRLADVGRAVGEVDVEALIGQPVGRLVGDEVAQRAGRPTGLLDRLAGGGLLGRLAGLDAAGGDLPAPGVGDEPVTPEQQQPAVGVVHDGPGGLVGHPHDVVLESLPAGQLDVDEHEPHPFTVVDGPFPVHRPAHPQELTAPTGRHIGRLATPRCRRRCRERRGRILGTRDDRICRRTFPEARQHQPGRAARSAAA